MGPQWLWASGVLEFFGVLHIAIAPKFFYRWPSVRIHSDFFFSILILGLPEQDNLVKDLKNKLKQENQENAKLNNEMTKKDTIINQLKEKLQIADCQR